MQPRGGPRVKVWTMLRPFKTPRPWWFAIVAIVAAALPVAARPAALTLHGAADGRLEGESDRGQPQVSPDGAEATRVSAFRLATLLGLRGDLTWGHHVSGGARLDTGDLAYTWGDTPDVGLTSNGVRVADEARDTAFVREAWLALEVGETASVRVEAGKDRLTLGDGLLLDAEPTGLGLAARWDAASLGGGLTWPGVELLPPGPPVVYAQAEMDGGETGRLGLVWARYTGTGSDLHDEIAAAVDSAAFTRVLQRQRLGRAAALACLDPPPSVTASSVLNWLGGTFDVSVPHGQLSGALLFDFGHFDTTAQLENARCVAFLEGKKRPTAKTVRTDARGHAAALRGRFHAGGPYYPGFFGLWLSGQAGKAAQGDYGGFLAISPAPERPRLFFDAAAGSTARTFRTATSGVAGRGVIAVGPTLLYAPSERLSVDLTAAWLVADEANPATGSGDLGEEADLRADWELQPAFALFGEVDLLRQGAFYPRTPDPVPGTAEVRFAFGLSFDTDSESGDP